MTKRLSVVMVVMSLLVGSMVTVQANENSKQNLTIDRREKLGVKLEYPNYIGETEQLKGYTFVDANGGKELYGITEWNDWSLSVFLLDDDNLDTANFPIKHFAYKEFGENKADNAEVSIDTASLTINGKNIEFEHTLTLDASEGPTDKGDHFESVVTPYFADSFADTCFVFRINTYFLKNGEYFWHSYEDRSGIALTPSMADEIVRTGLFKGQLIPGLKERILEYRNDSPSSVAAESAIAIDVNGNEVFFDVPPQIVNGRTMVPLRAICEALDVVVEFDDKTNTITMKKGDTIITHTIGEKTLIKDGVSAEFDTASMIIDGRTLVPTRMIAEAIGAQVDWIDSSRTVQITT